MQKYPDEHLIPPSILYSVEEIKAMLDGNNYYTHDQIMYIYYAHRGEKEKADIQYKKIQKHTRKLQQKLAKLHRNKDFMTLLKKNAGYEEDDEKVQEIDEVENYIVEETKEE